MKKNKDKKQKTYPQKLNGIMSLFFIISIVLGAVLGIMYNKANNANLTKAGLLSLTLIVFIMHYWILIDRFRLNKARVNKKSNEKIKTITAWSSIFYKYFILGSLLLLFILAMIDLSNYSNTSDWIIFGLSLAIVLFGIYKFVKFEIYFKKIYNFKLPKDLFVVK